MNSDSQIPPSNIVFYWIVTSIVMILIMVSIGGATRLTNSGLSIVEWKPITGIIPPLSEQDWINEFGKYQQSPEFKIINNTMNIDGFKKIFWLEFIHRLAGRITALVFFVPALVFWYLDKFDRDTKKTVMIVSILGLCQGIMGWYMVKSGLSSSPHVSHFRLTIHLLFALTMYLILILQAMKISNRLDHLKMENAITLIIAILQIALGGLVAGLNAGQIYNEFPLMSGSFLPNEMFEISLSEYLYNPAIVQFLHRICAYILSIFVVFMIIRLIKNRQYLLALVIFSSLFIQIYLGISTLVNQVPLTTALFHQFFAFILAGVILYATGQKELM